MFNEKQLDAIRHFNGPALVIAGPGSGKTTVIVNRIISLIKQGIEPGSILVITFTKEAALEMSMRFKELSKSESSNVTFGTFHSIFFSFLKKSIEYKDYEVLSYQKKKSIINQSAQSVGFDENDNMIIERLEKGVSYYKNTGLFLEDELISETEIKKFYCKYESIKERYKVIDFDDMLFKTKELFLKNEDIRSYCQKRFSYFLIDELQDINNIQFDVIKLLLNEHPSGYQNIFGVGDDDQAIYGFRGANPRLMLDFEKSFLGCKRIVLDRNYRSKEIIVNHSKILISHNKERFDKEYVANNKDKGKIYVKSFKDNLSEGEFVLKRIKNSTLPNETFGILYRNRSVARVIGALFEKEKVSYYSDESIDGIKNSDVCKDIISYLNIVLGEYERSDIIRIMNKPNRNLLRSGLYGKNVRLLEYRDFYERNTPEYIKIDEMIRHIEIMGRLSTVTFFKYLRNAVGYSYESDIFNDLYLLYKDCKSLKELQKELKKPEGKDNSNKRKDKSHKISMYTFHGSKGLEFDNVFIIDAVEGITPSKNAINNALVEEERRMFYVAVTRAKNNLYICVPKRIGEDIMFPSRFVSEMECAIINSDEN